MVTQQNKNPGRATKINISTTRNQSARQISNLPHRFTIEGAVNAYTPSPEDYIGDSSITYLQKGDTALLVKMSQENIEAVLGDDGRALKLAKRKRYLKAILKYNDDTINKLN